MKIANVLLPLPMACEFSYTYDENLNLKIGDVVKVPFGNRSLYALITELYQDQSDQSKLKFILELTPYNLSNELQEFINFVADYNLIPKGVVLKMVLSSLGKASLKKNATNTSDVKITKKISYELNSEQTIAFETLNDLCTKGFEVSVLRGVTGSGKTEVYLELVKKVLAQGKQVLILLPEILLTTQLIERFKNCLEFEITEWHSSLSPARRADTWKRVIDGDVKIIVGARSALYLPYRNLGLIIVDEEHESSFKQEEGGCYHARDMAVARAKINQIPIILCSATPSLETENNIIEGKYNSVNLTKRFGDACMPAIHTIDLLEHKPPKGQWITNILKNKIIENYSKNKQALIYLNRRGYSMITLCVACRCKVGCPNCEFNLVKHKSNNILLCHYCGYKQNSCFKCKNCGGEEQFADIGPGVERIAEEITKFLPDAKICIISSDTLSNRKKAQEAIDDIIDHKYDIIVGTQMIAKGLHFPKLDLVGVVDADFGLFSGDVRAFERTYQALKQVSGRAGRQSSQGNVYLQTLESQSYLLESIKNEDWQAFIECELVNRKLANMPPFTRITIVGLSGKSQEKLTVCMRKLTQALPNHEEIKFLGPCPAPIFMVRSKFRYRYIIISPKNINIQKLISSWLKNVKIPTNIDLRIDVDPISFS